MARALSSAGEQAVAIEYGGVAGPAWYAGAAERVASGFEPDEGSTIIVVHSGAGGLVPAIVEAMIPRPAAVIFVDAILPHPGQSWLQTAPASLAHRLGGLEVDGVLPPWNTWFQEDPIVQLIPDIDERASFVAELPRVALAYFAAPAPTDAGWESIPKAYLQLSDAYDAEAREARRRSWRVDCAGLHHLAMVTAPDRVAAMLMRLAKGLETT